jgi:hypothetical protein
MRRFVTPKLFESYTPVELALREATIDNAQWSGRMEAMAMAATGRAMHHDWRDRYFTKYINDRFPLPEVNVEAFEEFVLQMERAAKPVDRVTAAWFHSRPEGQSGFAYPRMDFRPENPSYSLFR